MKPATLCVVILAMFFQGGLPLSAQNNDLGTAAGNQAPALYGLRISDREGRTLADIALEDNRFDILFIHSFHLTPVAERYIVDEDSGGRLVLHLFELEYESIGVGMPSEAELGFRLENGKFELSMDRRFACIPLMISIVPGHGLLVRGKFLPFTSWLPERSMLVLSPIRADESHGGNVE